MCRAFCSARCWLLVGANVSTATRNDTQAAQPVHTGRKYIGPNRRQPRVSISWKAGGEICKMTRYSLDAVWSGRYWQGAGGAMYLKSSCSIGATLDEDFEAFAKVLRMGEGLELLDVRLLVSVLNDARQKSGLTDKRLGPESSQLAELLQGSEENMRGDILFAGICEQITGDLMPAIRARRSVDAFRPPKFLFSQKVIDRAQL